MQRDFFIFRQNMKIMSSIVLVDNPLIWKNLLPLTFAKSVSHLRIGILTIIEKWEKYGFSEITVHSQDYINQYFNQNINLQNEHIFISSNYLPDKFTVTQIQHLENRQSLHTETGELVAFRGNWVDFENQKFENQQIISTKPSSINYLWDLYLQNGSEIIKDFKIVTADRQSKEIEDKNVIIYNAENVHIEEGAKLKACMLNAENGPIYIGKNAEIKMGALIEGPFALCENARVNMGAKIRPNCTVGPNSVVGGELNNSILQANSNKGHEGYLGNSVLGEWVNLGADTNNSNLKNNFSDVKLWSYTQNEFVNSHQKFCGVFMGDHSKAGINTMFNTGTVVGFGANVFGGDFQAKYIPNFSWGKTDEKYNFEKFIEAETLWMKTKKASLTEEYKKLIFKILN